MILVHCAYGAGLMFPTNGIACLTTDVYVNYDVRIEMSAYTWGKIAYEAYCKQSDGKSLVSGAELPSWDDLNESIRLAWNASAQAVRDAAR